MVANVGAMDGPCPVEGSMDVPEYELLNCIVYTVTAKGIELDGVECNTNDPQVFP